MGGAGAALVGSRGLCCFSGLCFGFPVDSRLNANKHLAYLVLCAAMGTPQGLEGCSIALLS